MESALAYCRAAHFFTAMLAFGACGFLWGCSSQALRAEINPALRRGAFLASLVVFASGLVWLDLEAAFMSEDWNSALNWSVIKDVLFDTSFGRVWLVRLSIIFLLLIVLWLPRAERCTKSFLLSAAVVASLSMVDHGSMQEGLVGAGHRLNDALHLLCAAAWLGGLPPFLMCLNACEKPELRGPAMSAMMTYSRAGHVFVPLVVATGMINIALTSGGAPWPLSSPYRILLNLKIMLVLTMVCIALYNRYMIVPRLRREARAWRSLRLNSIAEVGLSIAIVALVSLFGLLDPA
jgi:putative copper resistance protein D